MSRIQLPAGVEQCVTASDLVRHFGIWQDRASRAPVYIMHRGRARLVLTSVELMEALCAPHEPRGEASDARVVSVLDAIEGLVLLIDRSGAIAAASRRARATFGTAVSPGASIAALCAEKTPFLCDAVMRVLASGIAETSELTAPTGPARRLACQIEPLPEGAIVLAHDITVVDELATLRARSDAMQRAEAATGATAWATVGLRGYVEDAAPSLAAMTGLAPDALAHARFSSLIEVGSRVAVTDALESVIADAAPLSVPAKLLVNRGVPLAADIGMAAIRQGPAVEGVAVSIVRAATN